jgi:ketosteroid isomerase-like protein
MLPKGNTAMSKCTLVLVVLSVFAALASPKKKSATADSDAIRGIIGEYAKSVDGADTNLASQIWSDSADVSFIYPRGRERGFEEIKRNIYDVAMGSTFSERKLNIHDVSIHVYGDAAWAEFDWDFVAKLRKDASPVTTRGMETQIYRKQASGWRLVHVHYSGMPVAEGQRP